ncbi:MAG TPA: response regulator transcription factor [Terriglobales bacterium]|nr:response regulator transcription factor [Terriglobales bacterium]
MKTLLIADDHFSIREILRRMFEENQEWSVAEAMDGRDAVNKVAQLRPDVVVLDFSMPVMNGLEAGAAIKRIRPRTPLILFTAYKDDFLEKQAYDKGFSVVVSKGEAANRLIESVRVLIRYGTGLATTGQPRRDSILRETKTVERRTEGRVGVDIEATVHSDRFGFVPARVSDLSERGFAAVLPVELLPGEVVSVELRFPQKARTVRAVIRNRNVFRHGFELLRRIPSEEVERLMEDS